MAAISLNSTLKSRSVCSILNGSSVLHVTDGCLIEEGNLKLNGREIDLLGIREHKWLGAHRNQQNDGTFYSSRYDNQDPQPRNGLGILVPPKWIKYMVGSILSFFNSFPCDMSLGNRIFLINLCNCPYYKRCNLYLSTLKEIKCPEKHNTQQMP